MIDPIAFQFGPLRIRWYGLITGLALLAGLKLVLWQVKNDEKIKEEFFLDFLIWALPIAIIGARLYYVLFHFDYYQANPAEILSIWHGGQAIHGSIIGGLIVLYFMCKKYQVSLLLALDYLAPAMILGQAIGRWGNFINQEAFGRVVSPEFINRFPEFIAKQMYINGAYHHPTFLYESIWNFMIFIILIILRKSEKIIKGDLFAIYFMMYSIGRYFIENIRTDSLMFSGFQVARIVSILMILIGLVILFNNHKSDHKLTHLD